MADTVLNKLFSSVNLKQPTATRPLISDNLNSIADDKLNSAEDRFLSGLAALFYNVEAVEGDDHQIRFDKGKVLEVISRIDQMIDDQMNAILHEPKFQALEANWRGLADLVENTNFRANIAIDVLDVAKEELGQDFENNSANIFNGALFNKVYIEEYDQFGGRPFGTIIGLYEFSSTPSDIAWLSRMGKVANAAHAPFVASASPRFFGTANAEEVANIKELDGVLSQPRFGGWNKFRDTEEAAYVGLTFPRYVVRLPWDPEKNPCDVLNFTETASGENSKYLWGNAAVLFARNLTKAFEVAGWCQSIRGPKAGGLVAGLPVDTFVLRGQDEIKAPVEITIPDYREYEFAKGGFIPLVYRKGSADAAFFSSQSAKLPKKFKDPKDSENSQLVTNLAYTYSVTRLAHYIKSIMRDNIGSTADATYIQNTISSWLANYVTTVVSPDDLTVRRFPFKAVNVEVVSKPGEIGWYDCHVSVLPHIQFEGLNVELRLESRLGK